MFQRHWQRVLLSVCVAGFIAGGDVAAQDVLSQLGLTDAEARQLFLPTASWDSAQQASMIVTTAREAYQALPPAARGPVTTGMYAWVKNFVNSTEFKAEYERHRVASMPVPPEFEGTVDEEIKQIVDRHLQEFDEMAQVIASMPADQRASMEATIESQRAAYTSPLFAASQRADIERSRAQAKADYESGMEWWPRVFPADQQAWIARQLREFLEATTDMDFTVKLQFWEGIPFTKDPKYEGRSWQFEESIYAGREATMAARAAAEEWLKEIGPE